MSIFSFLVDPSVESLLWLNHASAILNPSMMRTRSCLMDSRLRLLSGLKVRNSSEAQTNCTVDFPNRHTPANTDCKIIPATRPKPVGLCLASECSQLHRLTPASQTGDRDKWAELMSIAFLGWGRLRSGLCRASKVIVQVVGEFCLLHCQGFPSDFVQRPQGESFQKPRTMHEVYDVTAVLPQVSHWART